MTTYYDQTVFSPWLTPVRLVSTSNIAGTYYNGPNNNGVGATYTIAASSLTIDSVVCNVGDRVLLQTQTATYTQGIYEVFSIGATVVLQRAADQQSLEQIVTGQYVSVKGGSVNAGNFYTVIEPRPQVMGVSAIIFNPDPSNSSVSFSGGASTMDSLAVFADTAGNIKAQTTASTLPFGLSTSTGNLQATTGNVIAGSSGHAGTVSSFPATASKGSLALVGVANTGNTVTSISNDAMGQASVVNIPDPANAIGQFLVGATATPFTSGNFPKNSGTAGLMVDSGLSVASVSAAVTQLGQLYQASVTLTPTQMAAAYATPIQIVANPLASQMILVLQASVYTASTGNTAYATGTAPIIQYSSGGTNGAHGLGTIATAAGLVAGDITASTSQVRNLFGIATGALTALSGLGLYFSNATGAYTAGTGTNITFTVVYQLLTATV